MIDIPEDIRAVAIAVVDRGYNVGLIDAVCEALMAERERCAQAARDYLANEYMPDFGSLPDDIAAAILASPETPTPQEET